MVADDFGNGLLSAVPLEGVAADPAAGSALGGPAERAGGAAGGGEAAAQRAGDAPDAQRGPSPGTLREVARLFRALPPPAVLLGDLNTPVADRTCADC